MHAFSGNSNNNYSGMTAYICRRFIPTTAFLVLYLRVGLLLWKKMVIVVIVVVIGAYSKDV